MMNPKSRHLAEVDTTSPLVEAALDHAFSELESDISGREPHHIVRVFRMAQRLAKTEGADLQTVELIAALHDVKNFKFTGDALSGAREAERWLLAQGADSALTELVTGNIAGISFKGAETPTKPLTLEGKCVQDADRLDAIGAIGIARCFAYGGAKSRPLHDLGTAVTHHSSTDEYLNHQGTSINHFYEKLLLLKDRLNTQTAKELAVKRHAFMETFLQQFSDEWEVRA